MTSTDGHADPGPRRAAELFKELSSRVAFADIGIIDVPASDRANLAGRHVAHFTRKSPFQLLLQRQVPGLDVAPTESGGLNALYLQIARDVDDAVSEVGLWKRWDAFAHAVHDGEPRKVCLLNQADEYRVVGSQIFGQWIGVIGDSVARSNDKAVRGPIGESEARRKHPLAHLHTHIQGNLSDAAHQNFIDLWIVAPKAGVRTRRDGKILPARTIREGQFRRHLPAVADVKAPEPVAGGKRKHSEPIFGSLPGHSQKQGGKTHSGGRTAQLFAAYAVAHRLRAQSGQTPVEVEPALRSPQPAFGLDLVHVLAIEIQTPSDLVRSPGPIEVQHILKLLVPTIVGHETG